MIRSRSHQDFGMRTCNASNLWPDRLLVEETFTLAVTRQSPSYGLLAIGGTLCCSESNWNGQAVDLAIDYGCR
jgi:hypothetical protein